MLIAISNVIHYNLSKLNWLALWHVAFKTSWDFSLFFLFLFTPHSQMGKKCVNLNCKLTFQFVCMSPTRHLDQKVRHWPRPTVRVSQLLLHQHWLDQVSGTCSLEHSRYIFYLLQILQLLFVCILLSRLYFHNHSLLWIGLKFTYKMKWFQLMFSSCDYLIVKIDFYQ